jgi:hypothetical protein
MTNLFSTRQLLRFHEPIQVDKILYARFTMVLSGIFTFISAGFLITLLAIPDGSGWIYYLLFLGLLGIREYIKRRYSKYILGSSDDSPFIDILSLLKLRDRFGVSLIEQALMWGLTAIFISYLPILFVLLLTALRLVFQYRRLVTSQGPALPK